MLCSKISTCCADYAEPADLFTCRREFALRPGASSRVTLPSFGCNGQLCRSSIGAGSHRTGWPGIIATCAIQRAEPGSAAVGLPEGFGSFLLSNGSVIRQVGGRKQCVANGRIDRPGNQIVRESISLFAVRTLRACNAIFGLFYRSLVCCLGQKGLPNPNFGTKLFPTFLVCTIKSIKIGLRFSGAGIHSY